MRYGLQSHQWGSSDTSGAPYLLFEELLFRILEGSAGVQCNQAR